MTNKFAIIIVLAIIVLFSNIWGTSIYILDESKNATCAKEMYLRGDFIVPTYNGDLRTDKPPLHYYFMMLSYRIFGDFSPLAARLFSSLMGLLTIIASYVFVRKFINKNTAFLTCLILLSSLLFAVQFHLAVPDPYLIFFMTTGVFLFYSFIEGGPARHLYFGYVCLAIGFLSKGPVAVILPAFGLLTYFLISDWKSTYKQVLHLKLLVGALIILGITLPWYIAVYIATDGVWIEEFFLKHNVSRFTSTMEGHGGFPLAAPVIALAALLPSSVFIIQAVRKTWRDKTKNSFPLFALCCGSAILIFFSFSQTILPSYISPSLPFVAILLGYYFDQWIKGEIKTTGVTSLIILLIITAALPIGAYFGIKQDKSITELTGLSAFVGILPTGALLGLIYWFLKKKRMMIYAITGSYMIFFLTFTFIIFPQMDQKNPVYQSRDLFKDFNGPVYYYGRFNPSFLFYEKNASIPKITSSEQLNQVVASSEDVMIISRKGKADDLLANESLQLVFTQKDLFEGHTTLIFRKKASARALSWLPL